MIGFKTLFEKPWLIQQATTLARPSEIGDQQLKRLRTALYFLLAMIAVIFFLFTITLLQRSQSFDFQALAGEVWRPLTDTFALWVNTFVLFLASLFLFFAKQKAAESSAKSSLWFVSMAGLCSLCFLVGQLMVWQQLLQAGFYLTSNPANSYFYLLTGIHGVHIFFGIAVLIRAYSHYRNPATPQSLANFIALCATYWHFMLVVWLGLFALLTSDSETFANIAAWCGF